MLAKSEWNCLLIISFNIWIAFNRFNKQPINERNFYVISAFSPTMTSVVLLRPFSVAIHRPLSICFRSCRCEINLKMCYNKTINVFTHICGTAHTRHIVLYFNKMRINGLLKGFNFTPMRLAEVCRKRINGRVSIVHNKQTAKRKRGTQ